jgi:exonuclease VII small subunit
MRLDVTTLERQVMPLDSALVLYKSSQEAWQPCEPFPDADQVCFL